MPIPENPNRISENPENPSRKIQPDINGNEQKHENLFSPRFRSIAAMAGWDEEALLTASLIVEDTPDRQLKHKKRSDLHSFKTPPTNSRRKRKAQRRSPESIPIAVLDLDEDESKLKQDSEKIDEKTKTTEEVVEKNTKKDSDVSVPGPAIPCLDLLREELSCAICLDICYEPSTTPCGHSFCKKCLRSAADRCGKRCPKCRQLISNSRYCTVNTVLWNTIQLLFPQEVEARKKNDDASSALDIHEQSKEGGTLGRSTRFSTRNRAVEATLNRPETESSLIIMGPERRNHRSRYRSSRPSGVPSSRQGTTTVVMPSQDEDAAFALRLQREEFMEVEAFRVPYARSNSSSRDSFAAARANLRAMASQAINIRVRGQRGW
ncbi:hypothetical protein OROMI_032359 [Orobanche minor]